ncbi:hypothetical protein CDAR_471181 [Caerostris darwini]|uniref:Uncharacterized protein n=1 Tax=Caerostris darwini TaxID=1538125 RepID=A0AAV4QN10_9ARAC|nr:hypothetical protein CDAR_471181 [Caerostris darwini]
MSLLVQYIPTPKQVITVNPQKIYFVCHVWRRTTKPEQSLVITPKKIFHLYTMYQKFLQIQYTPNPGICDRRQIYPRRLPISPEEIRNNPSPTSITIHPNVPFIFRLVCEFASTKSCS